jgi:exodeoxyribonuclease VII small subunit
MMPEEKTFEMALTELQSIIENLESGSPSLAKMIQLFEEGMKLMSYCRDELNEVEDRIKTLIKDNNDFIEKAGID